jgi:hypothetical protein
MDTTGHPIIPDQERTTLRHRTIRPCKIDPEHRPRMQ